MINAQEFFTHALHDSEAVTDLLANDGGEPNIFEYPCEEELGDNPSKPYVVVRNLGTNIGVSTKDDSFDAMNDNTAVDVVCVTCDKDGAKMLAQCVREAVRDAMDEQSGSSAYCFGFLIVNSHYSDKGVQFDAESGNYFVELSYQIETEL